MKNDYFTQFNKLIISIILILGVIDTASPMTSAATDIQVQPIDAKLSASRHIFTVTKLNSSEWLIVGGHLEKDPKGQVSNSAEILTVSKKNSVQIHPLEAKMQYERWGHKATRLKNNDVFICGGSQTTECEKYSSKDKRFANIGRMTHARSASAQTLLPSGNVLITGGYNKGDSSLGKVLSSAEVFNAKTGTISTVASMSSARAGHATFVYRNQVYIIGGLSQESAVVEKFDEQTKSFSKTTMQLPYALKDFQYYQNGHLVYLIGGTKPDGNSISKILKIDLNKQSVEELPGELLEPREDMSICFNSKKNQALVFGGEIKGNDRNGIHSEKTELIKFAPFSITPTAFSIYRDDAQTISVTDKECLVIGGTNKTEDMELGVLRIIFY